MKLGPLKLSVYIYIYMYKGISYGVKLGGLERCKEHGVGGVVAHHVEDMGELLALFYRMRR